MNPGKTSFVRGTRVDLDNCVMFFISGRRVSMNTAT